MREIKHSTLSEFDRKAESNISHCNLSKMSCCGIPKNSLHNPAKEERQLSQHVSNAKVTSDKEHMNWVSKS